VIDNSRCSNQSGVAGLKPLPPHSMELAVDCGSLNKRDSLERGGKRRFVTVNSRHTERDTALY
jgi:hypothetical protein